MAEGIPEMTLDAWTNFFLGELGAAAALAGLLFVSVSVNQARILALGRMADRGLEALGMLLLVLVVSSLPLVPGQALRLLGAEILTAGVTALAFLVPLQRAYLGQTDPLYRRRTAQMVAMNRLAVAMITLSGAVLLWRGDGAGLYLLPPGILLTFLAAGANAWVLLIEINR
jgi:modulator of FtsH protease